MGKVLNYREIDWVTAPGDQYSLMRCPPPPCSDSSHYLSSLWIGTTGTVTVAELAPPERDPTMLSAAEKSRIQKWSFQAVMEALGDALDAAEDELSRPEEPVRFEPADVTLSEKAYQLLSVTFRIRADRITGPPPPPGAPSRTA